MTTGLVWDERYAWHQQGLMPLGPDAEPFPGPDTPETKRRIYSLVQTSGLGAHLAPLTPRFATEAELERLHTFEHVERVKRVSADGGGSVGESVSIGEGGYEIAALAAGGCMVAVDAVLEGRVDNAYALVRPAGHHAEAGRGRGFCVFGNTALAALHAQRRHGVPRLAIIDWDVHHGNGTEDAFYADPDVLTISIHQDRNYPIDRGQVEATGEGAGQGANVNVPLPPGSGHGAYVGVIEQVVIPALERFRPALIMIASGVDAAARDPLGRMLCSGETYRRMTELVMSAADTLCDGRLVACHEGGYAPTHAPFCTLAILETLAGHRTGVIDPMAERLAQTPGHALLPHQQIHIDHSRRCLEA
jgi:acetoin utilization deacetylase AcuC-like enzyme